MNCDSGVVGGGNEAVAIEEKRLACVERKCCGVAPTLVDVIDDDELSRGRVGSEAVEFRVTQRPAAVSGWLADNARHIPTGHRPWLH